MHPERGGAITAQLKPWTPRGARLSFSIGSQAARESGRGNMNRPPRTLVGDRRAAALPPSIRKAAK